MKKYLDSNHTELKFTMGDWVYKLLYHLFNYLSFGQLLGRGRPAVKEQIKVHFEKWLPEDLDLIPLVSPLSE